MFSHISNFLQERILWNSPERALALYRRAPRFFLDQYRLMNLRQTLALVREKSVFYSRLFEQQPFEISSIKSIQDLFFVFTTQKDLADHMPSDFLCNRPDTAFESTGTSSKQPKRIFFSNREIEDAGRIGAAGLWGLGLRPPDRVASAFDYSFWVSGPALKAALAVVGAFHVEAGRIPPEEFYERIKPYRCNVVVADPGWLVRLSEVAEQKGSWTMKFMLAGGENLSENARRYVESVWQTTVYLSYGQTEAFGMIGLECPQQKGYHVNEMDVWPEIPMTDKDGYGELVYTTLRRSVMPLVRYRSGDVTRFLSGPCPCGLRSARLEKVRHRSDEMIVTSIGNITPWMFNEVVEKAGLRLADWQLAVGQAERKDTIEFRAEAPGAFAPAEVRTHLLTAMKDHMPVAYSGIQSELAVFNVQIFKPGDLKKGRKIKRLVDERSFNGAAPRRPEESNQG